MLHYVEALFIDDIDHIVQQVGLMKQDPRKLALLPEDTILLYYVGLSGWMSYLQLKREKDPLVDTLLHLTLPSLDHVQREMERVAIYLKWLTARAGFRFRGDMTRFEDRLPEQITPRSCWEDGGCGSVSKRARQRGTLRHVCMRNRHHSGFHLCSCHTRFRLTTTDPFYLPELRL